MVSKLQNFTIENFRKLRSLEPLNWTKIHDELWKLCTLKQQNKPNNSSHKPQYSFRANNSKRASLPMFPHGFCWIVLSNKESVKLQKMSTQTRVSQMWWKTQLSQLHICIHLKITLTFYLHLLGSIDYTFISRIILQLWSNTLSADLRKGLN